MFNSVKCYFRTRSRYKQWRKMNVRNETAPMNDFDMSVVTVGNYTYGGIRVYNFNNKNKLKIGHFCSIAENVMFILDADHAVNKISTFPFKVKCLRTERFEAISKGNIIVDDDVWIGYGSTILSGVHIGQGAIVAAGAVVTKDVPPYSIVAGIPANVIKYRFEPRIIEELLKVDYSKLTKEDVENHINQLYEELKDVNQLDWLPKKKIVKI